MLARLQAKLATVLNDNLRTHSSHAEARVRIAALETERALLLDGLSGEWAHRRKFEREEQLRSYERALMVLEDRESQRVELQALEERIRGRRRNTDLDGATSGLDDDVVRHNGDDDGESGSANRGERVNGSFSSILTSKDDFDVFEEDEEEDDDDDDRKGRVVVGGDAGNDSSDLVGRRQRSSIGVSERWVKPLGVPATENGLIIGLLSVSCHRSFGILLQ